MTRTSRVRGSVRGIAAIIAIVAIMSIVSIVAPATSCAADLNTWAIQGNVIAVESTQRISDGVYTEITMTVVTNTSDELQRVNLSCPTEAGSLRSLCLSSVWFYCSTVTASSTIYDDTNGYQTVNFISCVSGSYGRCAYADGYARATASGEGDDEMTVKALAQLSAASCSSK